MGRLIFDISDLVRWHGPPVGIARVQQKFLGHALRDRPGTVFVLHDPRDGRFRPIALEHASAILAGRLRIDMSMMPNRSTNRTRSVDRVPRRLRGLYWWITKFRRRLLMAVEQWRLALGTRNSRLGDMLLGIEEGLLSRGTRNLYRDDNGQPMDVPAFDRIVGDVLSLAPGDTFVITRSDARFQAMDGARLVALCHDIIPIMFPQWYAPRDVADFTVHTRRAFALAERVIFTSRRSARDAQRFQAGDGQPELNQRVVPLGADPVGSAAMAGALPDGLAVDRYVLFVSTIEPRKNHRVLVDAWRQLSARGVVEGYRLVFVGRYGWMMRHLVDEVRDDPALATAVLHLSGVDDATLSALYRHAAFCVYPSLYEGYGLPPVEALAHGKPVLVSSTGPMAEIVGDFAVALDPHSVEAWSGQMARWIEHPDERDAYAVRAREEYRPVTWEESARMFLESVFDGTGTAEAPAATR